MRQVKLCRRNSLLRCGCFRWLAGALGLQPAMQYHRDDTVHILETAPSRTHITQCHPSFHSYRAEELVW